MIIGMLAFLLAAVLILLLIPIRYTVTLVRWRLTLSVSVLLGLWRKEIELPPAGEEPSPQVEMTEEPEMDWMEEALSQAEEKAEVHERLPDAAEAQAEREEKKGASLWREIRFAMGNGLAERVLYAAGKLLSHSFPRRCRIRGDFGTGDPMTTGIACGMAMAFLAQETKEIRWNYLEPVNTLSGGGKGSDHSFDYDLYSRQASPVETRQRVLAFQKRGKEPWMMKLESRSLKISRR